MDETLDSLRERVKELEEESARWKARYVEQRDGEADTPGINEEAARAQVLQDLGQELGKVIDEVRMLYALLDKVQAELGNYGLTPVSAGLTIGRCQALIECAREEKEPCSYCHGSGCRGRDGWMISCPECSDD